MTFSHDWTAMVAQHARATGVANLPHYIVDELACHLEDIHNDALSRGRSRAEALDLARAALAESALGSVPRPRTRPPEARAFHAAPRGSGMTGIAADLIYAWRQWRRS